MNRHDDRKAELKLIRIRRAEIAAMKHPAECKAEYIRLMRREVELMEAATRRNDITRFYPYERG